MVCDMGLELRPWVQNKFLFCLTKVFFLSTEASVSSVVCWITDYYHPCSNLGVGISEGCFIIDFASLPLEVARPI